MSANNVTPIRSLESITISLIEEMQGTVCDVPFDDTVPGFRATPETKDQIERIVPFLQEARRVLVAARERETPRFDIYLQDLASRGIEW